MLFTTDAEDDVSEKAISTLLTFAYYHTELPPDVDNDPLFQQAQHTLVAAFRAKTSLYI